jgi:hypothetical protein
VGSQEIVDDEETRLESHSFHGEKKVDTCSFLVNSEPAMRGLDMLTKQQQRQQRQQNTSLHECSRIQQQ